MDAIDELLGCFVEAVEASSELDTAALESLLEADCLRRQMYQSLSEEFENATI